MDDPELRVRAKRLMRRRFRSHRAGLPMSGAADRSSKICARLLSLDALRDAGAVALFWPIERYKEIDLRPVDQALRARGAGVAYPVTHDDGAMTFHLAAPDAMTMTDFGYLAPSPDAPAATSLDVIVVPGLAFDARGYRIGYGGGFYDRALANSRALHVGVAYDFQLAADIPNTPGDVAVDLIVTDARLLDARLPSASS